MDSLFFMYLFQQTRADKEVMRPLYDRYRAVKRLCSASSSSSRGGQSNSKSSVSTSNVTTTQESSLGTLNSSTVDTLPSITLLQSGMVLGSYVQSILYFTEEPPNIGHSWGLYIAFDSL